MHLRKQPLCLQVTREADVGPEEPGCLDLGGVHAWLPAAKLIGPRPWWSTLRPMATPEDEPTVEAPFTHLHHRLGTCVPADLHNVVRQVLESRVFLGFGAEDMPLTQASFVPARRDLILLLLRATLALEAATEEEGPAQSAATFHGVFWTVYLRPGHLVLRPVSVTQARWRELCASLPTEWVVE